VHATIEELAEHRDPKGLYKKALAGEIKEFTGVSPDAPYEVPENPELVVDTMTETPEESLQNVLRALVKLGYLGSDEVMVQGDRMHSGLTDLRVADTGHVVKES
jgi:adenylylsulfate kinase-like enzyme